jgi:hypothetical protein
MLAIGGKEAQLFTVKSEGATAMSERPVGSDKTPKSDDQETKEGRRPVLRKLGRFAAITPPAIALLLAAATKPASAATLSPVL